MENKCILKQNIKGLKMLVRIDISWGKLTKKVVQTGWYEFELEQID